MVDLTVPPPTTPAPASLTPLSAVTTWFVAVALVFAAGLVLAAAAAGFAVAAGLSADVAVRLISDPSTSPLFTNPTWIGATILTNELSVAAALWLALRRLRLSFAQVVPVTRPAPGELVGALLLAFGLAPVAELCARRWDGGWRSVQHST